MKTMLEVIRDKKTETPLIYYFGAHISYGEFEEYTNAIAAQISAYCDPGDTIAIIAENIPQFPMVQYAAWKNSCIFIPLSPIDSEAEIISKLKFTDTHMVIISSEFRDKFSGIKSLNGMHILYTSPETFGKMPPELRNKFIHGEQLEELVIRKKPVFNGYLPDVNDTAMLVFTSGTSGRQKAAVIRHKNIYAASYIYREWYAVSGKDKNLCIAPFFHITGLIFGISLTVISGASMVLTYRFDAMNTLETIESEKTTITMFVATAYRAMLNSWSGIEDIKNMISSMRLWSAGGMPMPVKTQYEWKAMTGHWIHMAYGLTESTSPVTLWEYPYSGELLTYKGVLTAGKPVYYTKLFRGKDGELTVSGPQIVDSYFKNPEDTAKSFCRKGLKTGDVCHIDKDRSVFIIDRKKDLIDVSGYKVVPAEVEGIIRKNPYVEDAVVIGEPDEYKGEVPAAYVKLNGEVTSYENIKENILETCRTELARYKVPARVIFVREMPLNASGKIKRSGIKSMEVVYQ